MTYFRHSKQLHQSLVIKLEEGVLAICFSGRVKFAHGNLIT